MKDIFEVIGISATLTVLIVIGWLLIISIISGLKTLKHRWRVKHRFNKPPTAECYCIDCQLHDNHNGVCGGLHGWVTADEWFCWKATPRKK
jgi:hypothetical protein